MRNLKIALAGLAALLLGFVGGLAGIGFYRHSDNVTSSSTPTGAVLVHTVTVVGTGKVSARPDKATVNLGVQVIDTTATAALDKANTSASALVAALKNAGVAEADIATTGLQVYPQYTYPSNKVTGFQAVNAVAVTVRDITKVGAVIDAAAAAAGNDITISGVSFSIADPEQLMATARSAAIDNATARAGQYAKAAGKSVGAVLQISETTVSSVPIYTGATSAESKGTVVQPGTQDLSVTVNMVFELK
jgi:hypothetical protein